MKTCLLILVAVTVAHCLPADVYKTEWEKFKLKFNRDYSAEEDEFRFKIFCKTLDMITEHNKEYEEGKTSFRMGLNQFSDLTPEERRKWLGARRQQSAEVKVGGFLPDNVYQTEWEKFKDSYKKLYDSPDEEERRFQIFCNNLDKIYRHNELYDEGIVTDKMGVNQFADLTSEEFKERMGLKPRRKLLNHANDERFDDYKREWQNFKVKYNRHYDGSAEEKHRYGIFSENLTKIIEHNEAYEKGQTTYKMTVTMFADMTKEEYLKWLEEEAGGHTWAPPHH